MCFGRFCRFDGRGPDSFHRVFGQRRCEFAATLVKLKSRVVYAQTQALMVIGNRS